MRKFLVLIPLVFFACATDTPVASTNARNAAINEALHQAELFIGKAGTQMLFDVARAELSGNKVDYGQAAAAGLWANVNAADTATAIQRVIQAYSAGKAPQTARAAAQVASPAITPETVNAIAGVISSAVGVPPAK